MDSLRQMLSTRSTMAASRNESSSHLVPMLVEKPHLQMEEPDKPMAVSYEQEPDKVCVCVCVCVWLCNLPAEVQVIPYRKESRPHRQRAGLTKHRRPFQEDLL